MKRIVKFGSCIVFTLMVIIACKNNNRDTKEQSTSEEFPNEMVNFALNYTPPVFKGTDTATWDRRIRERGFILYEDSVYKLWYTGYNPEISKQKFLGYATSTDGINWVRDARNPIFTAKWTEDMFVTRFDTLYYMFAEGENDIAHLLTSADGIHWQEKGDLIILSLKGDAISEPYGTPSVWVENNSWYLFYERNDNGIWIAKSDDKINWVNIQDEPVLKPGPDDYDQAAVAADQIVKFRDRYYLFYHSTSRFDWQHPESHVIWTSSVAMSTDLIHWDKYPGNPIIKEDRSSPVLVFDNKTPSLYTMHPQVFRYTSD